MQRMLVDAALLTGAVVALVLGYLLHRWRFLIAVLVAGIVVIIVDVSTRDLMTAGHDDRGLVAIAEGVVLGALVALFAVGVALRHWRDRRVGSGHGQPTL